MIKKFNIFFWVSALMALPLLASCVSGGVLKARDILLAAPSASAIDPSEKFTLPENERLVYQVKWLGITAGEFVIEIKGRTTWNGRECYLLEVNARTTGFVSSIYRVDDLYRSYLDVEKLYTLRHEERRHEGGYHKDAVTDFDHAAGKAHFRNAADGSEKTFDIPPGVQDSLTAAYVARLLPLAPGQVFTFKVCNSEKVYDLYLSVGARAQMKGRSVLHLVPFGKINGSDYREGRASGYVTDDALKIPLVLVVKAPVFTSVTATLINEKK